MTIALYQLKINMGERHECDKIRIKNLLGITVNTDTCITFQNLLNVVLDKRELVRNHVNKGVWTNPNCIILLKKCGFTFIKDDETCLYNLRYGNEYIGVKCPPQVYYTNKILSLLMKDSYFKDNYCDGIFVKKDNVIIEKRIENCYSNYGNGKRCDIGIHSIENDRFIIAVEINENHHKNRQTEDEKRYDDLLMRSNKNGLKFMKILILKLNENNRINKKILNEICKDIINNIKNLDSIFDEEKYTVNYLVKNGIGDENFCRILYNTKRRNKYVNFSDIFIRIEEKVKKEYVSKIEKDFLDWHDEYIIKIEDANDIPIKKKCGIFDDPDSNSDSDDESDNDSEDGDIDEVKSIRKMCIVENSITKLNFDGIIRFLQFLGMHYEYFKNINGYNYILKYTNDSSKCMMDAIHELYEIQHDFLHDKKIVYYGKYI